MHLSSTRKKKYDHIPRAILYLSLVDNVGAKSIQTVTDGIESGGVDNKFNTTSSDKRSHY